MFRAPFLISAIVLGLCALVALSVAGKLVYYGKWTLVGCAILLGTHAAGVFSRRPLSWVFAVAFFAITGLGYVLYGGRVVYEAFTFGGSDGWALLGRIFIVPAGVAIVVIGVLSLLLARALGKSRASLAGATPAAAWSGAVLGAVLSLAELGWLVGYEFHYRELPEQNACAGGQVLSCAALARKHAKFDREERREFAMRGCERGHLDSCRELLGLLDAGHDGASAEAKAIARVCETGMLGLCKDLGVHLLSAGDAAAAAKHLSFACETKSSFCSSSAQAAERHGDAVLAAQLLETGCAGDDARSCRAILRQPTLGAAERESLEMRTCLLGNSFADCRGPIARDVRAACNRICEAASRNYFCAQCAREAVKRGEAESAAYGKGLLEASCARGYRFACDELTRLARPAAARRR